MSYTSRLLTYVLLVLITVQPSLAADAARGKYLTVLGDCAGCHTKPKGADFAGGLPFKADFGTVYSTNITPDKDTGISNWSGDDFYRALHEGIAPGGKHLYPAFPYVYFRRVSRQDTDDLFAYLKTLKPVHQPPTPNKMFFPVNIRMGLMVWNWLYFDKTPPNIPANVSAEWKRGEYIVNGLGHCGACHTPKTLLFGDITSQPLAGGVVDHWFANNLNGGQAEGIGKWRHDEVVKFLATGINTHATAAGSMLEKVTSSTSHMTDEDRSAIATYLKSLPPVKGAAFEPPRREQMERGQGLYLAHCQSCHAEDGRPRANGPTRGYPSLAGDTLVMGHDPTTVLRVILAGATAPRVPGQPPVKPMPAFGQLNDGEIADMATYLRNAWGNRAPAVDATKVHALRQALKN